MGPGQRLPTDTHRLVIDIEAELGFWRRCYRKSPFHRRGLGFDAYVPTLKFGYDAYLLFHHHELGSLLPALKERYASRLPATQRLDWSCSQNIIRETWRRMQGETAADPAVLRQAFPPCIVAERAYDVPADGASPARKRQTVLPTSSAISSAPMRSCATPTGRPCASPLAFRKPASTVSIGPEGLPWSNGTNTTL